MMDKNICLAQWTLHCKLCECLHFVHSDGYRKPADLQDLAPGTNPPFVTFNGEVKVDVNMIEEFLENKLTPPRYTNTHSRGMNYFHSSPAAPSYKVRPSVQFSSTQNNPLVQYNIIYYKMPDDSVDFL